MCGKDTRVEGTNGCGLLLPILLLFPLDCFLLLGGPPFDYLIITIGVTLNIIFTLPPSPADLAELFWAKNSQCLTITLSLIPNPLSSADQIGCARSLW